MTLTFTIPDAIETSMVAQDEDAKECRSQYHAYTIGHAVCNLDRTDGLRARLNPGSLLTLDSREKISTS